MNTNIAAMGSSFSIATKKINTAYANRRSREMSDSLLMPSDTSFESHEPTRRNIKPFTQEEIELITSHLLATEQYRELMMFVVGINFGLRYSDLSQIRFGDLITADGEFRDKLLLTEQKTGKVRTIYAINQAVKNAVTLYLHNFERSREDYLFESISNNKKLFEKKPMSHTGFQNIIKRIAREVGLEGNYNTHSLRKTFGYMYMAQHDFAEQNLYTLQEVLNHSSAKITLRYIGITDKDIQGVYEMNLGCVATNNTEDANTAATANTSHEKAAEASLENQVKSSVQPNERGCHTSTSSAPRTLGVDASRIDFDSKASNYTSNILSFKSASKISTYSGGFMPMLHRSSVERRNRVLSLVDLPSSPPRIPSSTFCGDLRA